MSRVAVAADGAEQDVVSCWCAVRCGFLLTLVAATAAAPTAVAGPEQAIELFVAPDGSDASDGSQEHPLATLEGARDATGRLQDASSPRPVTVWMRGGRYVRSITFTLTGADSGTANAPVRYQAWPGESVSLVGGVGLQPSWFIPVTERSVLQRLPPPVRGRVLQVDLPAHEITNYGEMGGLTDGMGLFCDGNRLPLARWPNEGWAEARRAEPVTESGKNVVDGSPTATSTRTLTFRYGQDPPRSWKSVETVWLRGYWHEEYFFEAWQPCGFDGPRQRITLDFDVPKNLHEWKRFVAVNVLEELDQPGEWYLDRQRGPLYLLPAPNFDSGPVVISMMTSPLLQLQQTSHVTIHGLTLEATRGTAIVIEGGTGNRIRQCTIRGAREGVVVAGGTDNGIDRCHISDLEAVAVRLSGGDRTTLTPAKNFATNNHIHDYARFLKSWNPGVKVEGVGQRVAHNHIHHAPQYAISYEGNDHLFELNELHDLCLEMSDVGAIGCGTDWTYRGNIIRHNFIHHLPKRPYPGTKAVYLDNCASSAIVFGNVFYQVETAVLIGGGRDNEVENNLFIRCETPVSLDNRGLRWRTRWGHFRPDGPMYEPLRKFRHDQPPWSTRYPRLARILDEIPQAPLGNTLKRNVSIWSGWRDPEAECRRLFETHIDQPYMRIEGNYVTDDNPGFVAAEQLNFQLHGHSVVYREIPGFQPIPFEQIGPQQSPPDRP